MAQEDQLLPIANVGRIMKQTLPPSAKISKEAKETLQECATEFISFVTGEASDKCRKENRKTLTGDDICWALSALGFDNYAEAIVRYLHKFREAEREKASSQNKAACSYQVDKHNIEESSKDKNGQPNQQQTEEAPTTTLEL
ncbi:hypothetical protein PTKIN_Ptkin06aG0208400 [Pterospermum kingtungense]